MLTPAEIDFIRENGTADTSRLLLNAVKKGEHAALNIPLCVKCIEARRKIGCKIPLWYANDRLVYPLPLSVEQCSSQATALYKQNLIKGLLPGKAGETKPITADLTGGMGVDSYFISCIAEKHYYIERNELLCQAAQYNFGELGAQNITVLQTECLPGNTGLFNTLAAGNPALLYMDPARRSHTNTKVISLKEYEPDLTLLKEELFRIAPYLLVKVSPMADIKLNIRLLPETSEIHVVSVDNECKELLFLLKRPDAAAEAMPEQDLPDIYAVNIHTGEERNNPVRRFHFTLREEEQTTAEYTVTLGKYLYEPNKSILKSGAYKLVGRRTGLKKLAPSTHLYTGDDIVPEFPGKVFPVIQVRNFTKKELKEVARQYPKADIAARNFPLDTNGLKKLSGIKDGGFHHIFAVTLFNGEKKIIVCEKTAL